MQTYLYYSFHLDLPQFFPMVVGGKRNQCKCETHDFCCAITKKVLGHCKPLLVFVRELTREKSRDSLNVLRPYMKLGHQIEFLAFSTKSQHIGCRQLVHFKLENFATGGTGKGGPLFS